MDVVGGVGFGCTGGGAVADMLALACDGKVLLLPEPDEPLDPLPLPGGAVGLALGTGVGVLYGVEGADAGGCVGTTAELLPAFSAAWWGVGDPQPTVTHRAAAARAASAAGLPSLRLLPLLRRAASSGSADPGWSDDISELLRWQAEHFSI